MFSASPIHRPLAKKEMEKMFSVSKLGKQACNKKCKKKKREEEGTIDWGG